MKLTDQEKAALVSAMGANAVEPQEVTEKVTKIVRNTSGALSENDSKALICCRYYSMGRYRYVRTSESSCRAVVGDVVSDSNCG